MAVNVAAKPTLLAVRLLAGLFLYLAYASPIAAQNVEKTRLGITDMSFTFLPHILAKDAGIFRKHGMDVELIYVGGPVSISAMAAGELDYNAAPDPACLRRLGSPHQGRDVYDKVPAHVHHRPTRD